MRTLLFIFCFVFSFAGTSQDLVCSDEDRQVFREKLGRLSSINTTTYGQRVVAVGKTFLGTNYVANTLDLGLEEPLVVNLGGLDCTTYVENVLVFARLIGQENPNFKEYINLLENIRYRNGQRSGYGSRLHYFSEWLSDNEKKGWLRVIGKEVGGTPFKKSLDFMSTHRKSYMQLAKDENFELIKEVEKNLTEPLYILPRDRIAANEHLLKNGDIVALATDIPGLDVTHTGILVRLENGRIHLLHASVKGGVEISANPLVEYLEKIDHNIGILVARPLP